MPFDDLSFTVAPHRTFHRQRNVQNDWSIRTTPVAWWSPLKHDKLSVIHVLNVTRLCFRQHMTTNNRINTQLSLPTEVLTICFQASFLTASYGFMFWLITFRSTPEQIRTDHYCARSVKWHYLMHLRLFFGPPCSSLVHKGVSWFYFVHGLNLYLIFTFNRWHMASSVICQMSFFVCLFLDTGNDFKTWLAFGCKL